VLVWSAVQVMWYRRGRIVPGEAQPVSGASSAARLLAALTRSADVSETAAPGHSPLSIAPARQPASEVETPSAVADHASDMWETMDADWFDEALRMSEMRGGSQGHPSGSPRMAGDSRWTHPKRDSKCLIYDHYVLLRHLNAYIVEIDT
jgi:hypothetical protein